MIQENKIICGDCLDVMRAMPDNSVDMVFDSPPYEDARTYDIDFKLTGDDWVEWMVDRTVEALRICKRLVATVVEGRTRGFRYSSTPSRLEAALDRRGVCMRKPPIFHRVGIPGSGGPDWLRNDYEPIVCCTSGGRLPWSDNTAMGSPPKYAPGGEMSYRLSSGERRNHSRNARVIGRKSNGDMRKQKYVPPKISNPGNVIKCVVGGSNMGSPLAHENEAAFPESLAEFFVRSFCPPGGVVLDRFCGSGTTLAVAKRFGRKYIGIDVRDSQVELSKGRVEITKAIQ